MKLPQSSRTRCNFLILAVAFCIARDGVAQSGAPGVASVSVDGTSAVKVALPPTHGGTVLPLPEAIWGTHQGTLAIKIAVTGFPSNAAVLDFGIGENDDMADDITSKTSCSCARATTPKRPSTDGTWLVRVTRGRG